MKRKLFSAILFGALLTASTSGLTSCKDYDDDITNLQGQIDKLATKDELSAKANELAKTISQAQQAASAAADVAQDAKTAANNASTDAKAAADAAKAAQTAADKVAGDLATAVSDAAQQIQDAVKNLATKQEVADAVKEVKDKYDAQAKDLKALSDRLAKVEAKLGMGEGGEDIDLTEIQKELEAIEKDLEAIIGKVADMVTSVELVYSSAHNGATALQDNDLDFSIVTEQKNETFGKDVADKILTTTKGHTKFYGDDVIIRVNPVDAEFSASDVSLINSKGEELTGLVEATKVERYTSDKYLTRAAGANTGLWKVTFAPVDGKKADDLKKKFVVNQGTGYETNNYIVYGVAIKSAINDTISADRRVVSAYDVTMKITEGDNYIAAVPDYRNPAPTDSVGIAVNNKWIKYIKNRYVAGNKELIWNTNEPAVTPVKPGANSGTVNTTDGDNRSGMANLVASVGEEIKIKFAKKIKGFYVTLDRAFATESAPSEINAWDGYTYENVAKEGVKATMFEGSEGTIKVSELSHNVTGDEIGFRIYAMNLDGTLVDPDGIAFYVLVGEAKEADIELGAKNLIVTKPAGEVGSNADVNFNGEFVLPSQAFKGYTFGTIVCKNAADNSALAEANYIVWYKEGNTWKTNGRDGRSDAISEMKNVTAVGIQILTPMNVKDNATYKVTIPLQKTASNNQPYTVKNAVLTFTKKLPESAPAYVWNVGQTEEQILKTSTANDWTYTNGQKDGVLDYNDVFIQTAQGTNGNLKINNDHKFVFSIAATKADDNGNYTKPLETKYPTNNNYKATIPYKLIDCATPHAVSTSYNYGEISSETYRDNSNDHDWIVNTTSGYSIKYMTWSYQAANYMQYAWRTNKVKHGNTTKTVTFDEVQIAADFTIDLGRIVAKPGNKIPTELRMADLYAYEKTANWLEVKGATLENNGIVNPYFEYQNTINGVVNFARKAGVATIPEHSEVLKLVVEDCFGHKETIQLTIKFLYTAPEFTLTSADNADPTISDGTDPWTIVE